MTMKKTNQASCPATLHLGGRSFTASVIAENWQRIARHLGSPFASSAEVMEGMHQLGIQYTLDGSRFKKANAMGDILGTKHFNLPSSGSGKRSFYLPAIAMSAEERAAFAGLSTSGLIEEIRKAKAMLLEGGEDLAAL